MRITGAKAMVLSLEKQNIDTVFGYPGAAICPFYDALFDSGINHILTRQEQGAAHAASGYSRISGRTGVCIATSGPGATNLLTGIATAYLDSIPLVAITGQVDTASIGKDVFQEVDITGACEPFIKYSYLIKNVYEIPRVFKEAFYIAGTGRPGPVLIDVPADIQKTEADIYFPESVSIRGYDPVFKTDYKAIEALVNEIRRSKRPVICAGGGIITSKAYGSLKKFAEKYNIPVVTTLMGIGSIGSGHPLHLGMLGSHGVYTANHAIHNADLIIVIGARIGDRAMGKVKSIRDDQCVAHIDIDPAEVGKNISVKIPIIGDARDVLEHILKYVKDDAADYDREWNEHISAIKNEKKYDYSKLLGSDHIRPQLVLKELSSMMGKDDIITTEVGQNQIWAANHIAINGNRKFLSSGGLGTMGYGLPCAIGAKTADRKRQVIDIAGDGSFQMSIQELATVSCNNLGVKVLLLNNSRLGMVREVQTKTYGKRYCATNLDGNPDFMKIAEAYGISSKRITSPEEVIGGLKEMLECRGPYILECIIDKDEDTLN
jgi:acetolactate synthase I/II/III large subunit